MIKRVLYLALFCMAIATSCQKTNNQEHLASGLLSINMSQPVGTFDYNQTLSKTKSFDRPLDDYQIKIAKLLGGEQIYSGRWADMPKQIELESGIYTITAESEALMNASYDNEYYYTSDKFTINTEETTNIAVKCELSNVKVSVAYSTDFALFYDNFKIEISNGIGTLEFGPSVSYNSGFFAANGALIVKFTGTNKILNKTIVQIYTISGVKPKDHHRLTFDVAPTKSGGFEMTQQLYNDGVAIF